MARVNQSGATGGTVDEVSGAEAVSAQPEIVSDNGQNSPEETGDKREFVESERAPLKAPKSPTWEAYRAVLDDFEVKLITLKGTEYDIESNAVGGSYSKVRILEVTVPIAAAPPFHIGTFSGYGIIKGDEFTVKLSNGKYIRSK